MKFFQIILAAQLTMAHYANDSAFQDIEETTSVLNATGKVFPTCGRCSSGTGKSTLVLGQVLQPSSSYACFISSDNQNACLAMQDDGNLVLYGRNADGSVKVKWAMKNGVACQGTICTNAVLQATDGNFVVYTHNTGSAKAVWASGTAGKGYTLNLQNDCNVVIRDVSSKAVWATGTNPC